MFKTVVNHTLLVALSSRKLFGISAIQCEAKVGYLRAQRILAELILKNLVEQDRESGKFKVSVHVTKEE